MRERELSLAEAGLALSHVDPHDRDTWLRMGMALKAEFGDAAFETWDGWSAAAANYRARDARDAWKSFKASGRVTLGSLIHAAREGGWRPPEQALPEAERRRLEQERAERERERRRQARAEAKRTAAWRKRIAELAGRCWAEHLHSVGQSPYLGRKRVRAHELGFARRGVLLIVDEQAQDTRIVTGREAIAEWFRSDEREAEHISFRYLKPGTVAVPMRDKRGTLWGLQFIFSSGAKQFLRHSRKQGCFHAIGDWVAEGPLALAEGYATGASIHEATGWPVAVTFDAGNLLPVAKAVRARYPGRLLIFCGDDDHESERNAGRLYAGRAAAGTGGITAFPRFEDPAGRSDWNDLHLEQGLAAVREQLLAHLEESTPARTEAPPPTGPSGQGGGPGGGGGEEPPPPEPPDEGPSPPGSPPVWESLLVRNQNGAVKATLHNVITVLEHHEAWAGLFALDGFANQIQRRRAAPYGSEPGPIADVDGAEVAAWFGDPRNYGLSVSSGMALEAMEVVATRQRFHPVLRYLDGLAWDGIERLPSLLPDFFGAAANDYTAAVGRNWLISAVARVRRPGCKVDFMVILEGEQGRGKSSAVRILCGPEWFAEMLESPQNKDFYQVLAGRWIIEIPELQAFNKADRNKIKAAVSAQEDTYRPSYGRYARQFPRQNIFIGTTNDDAYLKDETGARRFLPVRCGQINLIGLEAMRDQLWAEADARFRRGETFWEFPASAEAEQDLRYDADAWEEPIVHWLDGHAGNDAYPPEAVVRPEKPVAETTISEVMTWALKVEVAKQTRPDQMRVGSILRRLGWRRERKMEQGKRTYVYRRPEADS